MGIIGLVIFKTSIMSVNSVIEQSSRIMLELFDWENNAAK